MWKKGESGNPTGGQKKKLITSHIERELQTLADDAGTNQDATKARRVAEKVVGLAVAGNPWAVQFVTERVEGKPDQNINIRKVVADLSEDELRAIAAGSGEGTALPAASEEKPSQLH